MTRDEAVTILLTSFKNDSPNVRTGAVPAIWAKGFVDAFEKLGMLKLDDSKPENRGQANDPS